MAQAFNRFFVNVANDIVSSIPVSNQSLDDVVSCGSEDKTFKFSDINLSISEIIDAISCLKDKTTLDMGGISSNFIKKIAEPISKPLYIIFAKSMESGEIPSQLKMAKIIPLFKSGDKSLMDNYRPIALLDTFSKIFEKIICKRLTSFLESNEKITPFQFGFRKEHSTVHPMLHFMNFVSEKLEKKHHVLAIFCDLRKAFDCCDHNILLKKLFKLGIKDTELNWFRSYLNEPSTICFYWRL
jgi:hypothetical protein